MDVQHRNQQKSRDNYTWHIHKPSQSLPIDIKPTIKIAQGNLKTYKYIYTYI